MPAKVGCFPRTISFCHFSRFTGAPKAHVQLLGNEKKIYTLFFAINKRYNVNKCLFFASGNTRSEESPMNDLEQQIKKLPPALRQEVADFVQFLLEKRVRQGGRKLRQDWAGALRDYRDRFTALELQKKALEWRGD